jgi:hypothetical protein
VEEAHECMTATLLEKEKSNFFYGSFVSSSSLPQFSLLFIIHQSLSLKVSSKLVIPHNQIL